MNEEPSQRDDYTKEIPKFLNKEELRELSAISSTRFLLALFSDLLVIAGMAWLSETYWSAPLYLFTIIIIGSRIHGLAVLMHETAHYRAFRNRKINDAVGELIAWPLTITMFMYRNNHFAHHREVNTEQDPDWTRKLGNPAFTFPKSRAVLYWHLLLFIIGIKTVTDALHVQKRSSSVPVPSRIQRVRYAFLAVLVISSIMFGFWKQLLLYWVVPLLTFFGFFEHIRSAAEHFGLKRQHVLNETRTVIAPAWECWLVAPHGIHYHLEHHLYPSIPFFRLAGLHKKLMAEARYAQSAHITKGYFKGLFQELTHPQQQKTET